MIYKLNGIEPKFDENCYVADTASVIGRVFTGKNVSVWFSAVVRGDVCDIRIGDRSNIQDNVTIHGDKDNDVIIGKNVTIHPGVTIGKEVRGRRQGSPQIGDNVWIGANAIIVGNIQIGNNVLIAPGSYINFDVPADAVVLGNPGNIIVKKNAVEGYIKNRID